MKIQIATDLHLEYLRNDHPRHRIVEHMEADVLVLAGDIAMENLAVTDHISVACFFLTIFMPVSIKLRGEALFNLANAV